ncbi:MAG: SET domain-containing protein-lysine N-methyltransferase [Parachlamydiales bacterium]|nr:SET domain-containing protein-lysine N-methyltransferase [Parachlamydiales bacterium]
MIFEKDGRKLTLEEFEKLTGAKWIPKLEFENEKILPELKRQCEKLYEKGELTIEQTWLGKYYENEILTNTSPNIAIRYIDPHLGWGVFALQDFKKMQFIAEYVGKVRKRKKEDEKNAYCFEYVLCQGFPTPYTIDAQDQGAAARYINHSENPNLNSALATFEHLSHVILFAKEPIAKGTQLCYDYGPDYWSKRKAPLAL